jgi:hypothetical protein
MLPTSLLVLVALAVLSISSVRSFVPNSILRNKCRPSTSLDMSLQDAVTSHLPRILSTIQLADTSISEEEVLNTIGQAGDLPDPFFTVLVAGVIVLGVAVLQFSLGDLTKEVKRRNESASFVSQILTYDSESEYKSPVFV